MITAVALGGGGAKGSFQVGALRYLYDEVFGKVEPLPTVLSGTSVGAVNATKLAEGGDIAFRELEQIWLRLRQDKDMYVAHPWFEQLESNVHALLTHMDDFGFLDILELVVTREAYGVDIDEIEKAVPEMQKAKALHHLTPIRDLMTAGALSIEKVRKSKTTLRLAVICLETGDLRYVTETGALLERDNKTPVPLSGWSLGDDVPPECQEFAGDARDLIQDIPKDSPTEVPQKGKSFENPLDKKEVKAAIDAAIGKVNECWAKNPVVSLADGVLASAAIPCVFDPIRLLGQTYVDGGVREVVPIQVALDSGATKVYAIACSRPGMEDGNPGSNIPEIALRALNITLDEVIENEATRSERWRDAPVMLIRPSFQVHDALTVDPSLIRINMAYGYMRADDIHRAQEHHRAVQPPATPGTLRPKISTAEVVGKRSSDDITRIWLDVDRAERSDIGPLEQLFPYRLDEVSLDAARFEKKRLRARVRERLMAGSRVPPGIEQGWLNWQLPMLARWGPPVWPLPKIPVPPGCKALDATLNHPKTGLRRQLQNALSEKPAGPQKGGAPSKEVSDLKSEIDKVEKQLRDCINAKGKFTADPATHGLLLRGTDSPDVFVLYGGSKLTLRGADPMTEMHYDPDDVATVPDTALQRIPTDHPADGTLLTSRLGVIHEIVGGARFRREPGDLEKRKLDKTFVRLVPQATLEALPTFTLAPPLGPASPAPMKIKPK